MTCGICQDLRYELERENREVRHLESELERENREVARVRDELRSCSAKLEEVQRGNRVLRDRVVELETEIAARDSYHQPEGARLEIMPCELDDGRRAVAMRGIKPDGHVHETWCAAMSNEEAESIAAGLLEVVRRNRSVS